MGAENRFWASRASYVSCWTISRRSSKAGLFDVNLDYTNLLAANLLAANLSGAGG